MNSVLPKNVLAGIKDRIAKRRVARRDASPVDPELQRFSRFGTEFSLLEGWFLPTSVAEWDSLLTFQSEANIEGNCIEFGVWKGRSAALMALHARGDETCINVDLSIPAEVRQMLEGIRPRNNIFVECFSENIANHLDIDRYAGTCRWIHIDGGHTYPVVMKDLETAKRLIADKGIICLDDFLSTGYPQITFATAEFLMKNPAFTLFLCGTLKGYICRKADEKFYLRYVRERLFDDLTKRGMDDFSIWKSDLPENFNCFGIGPKEENLQFRGLDSDKSQVPY